MPRLRRSQDQGLAVKTTSTIGPISKGTCHSLEAGERLEGMNGVWGIKGFNFRVSPDGDMFTIPSRRRELYSSGREQLMSQHQERKNVDTSFLSSSNILHVMCANQRKSDLTYRLILLRTMRVNCGTRIN